MTAERPTVCRRRQRRGELLLLIGTLCLVATGVKRRSRGERVSSTLQLLSGPQLQCSTIVEDSGRRLTVNGNIVHVAVQSLATHDGAIAIVGTPTYVFPRRDSAAGTAPAPDSIIGAIVRADGSVQLVPSPLPKRHIIDPRVTFDGSSLLAVFAESASRWEGAAAAELDSGILWYGRFAGGTWHELRTIARLRSAGVFATVSSDLMANAETLAFAYPYDRSGVLKSNGRGNQGVVLLRRVNGTWYSDTLFTEMGPNYVKLHRGVGLWNGLILQPYFARSGRPRATSLFLAQFDSEWHQPQLLTGDGVHPLIRLMLTPASPLPSDSQGMIVSWELVGSERRIQAARIDSGVVRPLPIADSSSGFQPIRLDEQRLLWLIGDPRHPEHIRAVMRYGKELVSAGSIVLPEGTILFRAAATGSAELVLESSVLGPMGTNPPGWTTITHAHVVCAGRP